MKLKFWKSEPDELVIGSDAWKDEKDLLSERELYGHYPDNDEDDEEEGS